MRTSLLRRTLLAAVVPLVVAPTSRAKAQSLAGTYYRVLDARQPGGNPDFGNGIDGLTRGLVEQQLGPDGLPVATAFARTRTGGSGPIRSLNAGNEILWWSAAGQGVAFEKSQTDVSPFAFATFYPDGQSGDAPYYRTARWQGLFTLATPGTVTFSLGSDDDAWVFIDGVLVVDGGGVKPNTPAPFTSTALGGGQHRFDLFYADRYPTAASLTFAPQFTLTAPSSTIPEPSTYTLVGGGLAGVAVARRRRRARAR